MDPTIIAGIIGAIGGIVGSIIGAVITILPQIRRTNERIDNLFFYTMSGPMYENLRKLAEGRFTDYNMSAGLTRELYHLRDTGLIEITDRSQHSIQKIPPTGNNLQQYVVLTDVGRRFIEARRRLDEQRR
jgi:hypothetical protein